jgi:hypothetical protein
MLQAVALVSAIPEVKLITFPLTTYYPPVCFFPALLQAAALVGAIPEMKLEIYALKRQEKAFASLASGVKDAFLKHADPQVGG